ncbi:MAG: amylo-alpha-1,6-glucosidase, partial [Myxococcota bacterium]
RVITPRIGKPVEINALWFNALQAMVGFAKRLNKPDKAYAAKAEVVRKGFERFWNNDAGYCFDVIDGPAGNDAKLRPNQLFAVSLPNTLLDDERQRKIVQVCGETLLTSMGLRSLAPQDPDYLGRYGGPQARRDGAYHQGTVWAWLIGPYISAFLKVSKDPRAAMGRLQPLADHLMSSGVGTISEIFDGDVPTWPRGCIAQAWSVGEALRALELVVNTMAELDGRTDGGR